ncbi:helix-turn-helix domain-containing protein [Agrobacterium tumefaciens]|nr:helix-turn-helix domain-containing protein [Agrobacterium tumefaciens]
MMNTGSFEAPLARSRFDTRQVPKRDAMGLWRDSINVLFDARLRRPQDDGFFASVDAAFIGNVALGRTQSSAQDFDRSRHKLARDGMDGFLLQFYASGKSMSRRGSGETAGPGDLYLIDMAQPLATATTDHDHLSLVVPRRLLEGRLVGSGNHHERVLPAGLPLVSLLRETMTSIYRHFDVMNASEGAATVSPLLDLAAAAINNHVGHDNAQGVQRALRASIRRYIDNHLLDPALSVEKVMGEFGVSRRTVYRLFEPLGGFSACITHRRLERAMDFLRAPQSAHMTIAEVAASYGFTNPENFSRVFKKTFGLSPRQMRHFASENRDLTSDIVKPDSAEWTRWIVQLGR